MRLKSVIALLVLTGLWFMHGISASTGSGCHAGAMPLAAAMAQASAMPQSAAMPQTASAPGPASVTVPPASDMERFGELCLSGQPTDPGAAFLLLLALLAVTGCLLLGGEAAGTATRAAALFAHRWRAPPGLFGITLLTSVCVSRT